MPNFNPLYFVAGMSILGLAPFFLMMVTSYVKIVVVTSLVRNALGVQQVPPAVVMNGLAIILSVFIMAPTIMETTDLIRQVKVSENPSPAEILDVLDHASPPLRAFLAIPLLVGDGRGAVRRAGCLLGEAGQAQRGEQGRSDGGAGERVAKAGHV